MLVGAVRVRGFAGCGDWHDGNGTGATGDTNDCDAPADAAAAAAGVDAPLQRFAAFHL